jgi:glycosyltransferase involved in cell wall biosynthesis
MNVLITFPPLNTIGGVAVYYTSILPILAERQEIRVSYLEIGTSHLHGVLKNVYKYVRFVIDQIMFQKSLSRNTVDLVHLNASLNFKSFIREGIFIYFAKKRRLPVLVFFHGWEVPFESQVEDRFWWFFKETYMKADGFIVLHSSFEEKLRSWGITVPIYRSTTTIDEGLLSDFSITKKLTLLRDSTKTKILFLSRLEKEKGIFETLEAMSLLLQRGHQVSLTIAGDGPAMADLRKYLTRDYGYRDSVELTGYVVGKAKKEAFTSHHIFCFPTYYGEGMPIVVIEAMGFGMPLVVRAVGGLKDFFQNGKMGYITESKAPTVIADLLERLISDKERMMDMALYNYSYTKENFMARTVAEKLVDIYKRVYETTIKANEK